MTTEDLSGGFNETGDEGAIASDDTEARAREAGWKPEDEWVGDKSGWMPAEDFLARNERLKSRGDTILKTELDKVKAELAETRQTIKDVATWKTTFEKRVYEDALADIERRQKEAFKVGDEKAFDAANRERDKLQKELEAKPSEPTSPDDLPAFKTWVEDNDWYRSDKVLRGYANEIAPDIARQFGPQHASNPAYYKAIAEEVKSTFPAKFRPAANAVEGVNGNGGKPKGKTYADLPAEYKQACDRMTKRLGITREEYLKGVDWENL